MSLYICSKKLVEAGSEYGGNVRFDFHPAVYNVLETNFHVADILRFFKR